MVPTPCALPGCRCPAGWDLKAGICYKRCEDGWSNDATGLSCVRNSCNNGEEDNGITCYPSCRSGYCSNQLTMCIECACPGGYRNDALSCW